MYEFRKENLSQLKVALGQQGMVEEQRWSLPVYHIVPNQSAASGLHNIPIELVSVLDECIHQWNIGMQFYVKMSYISENYFLWLFQSRPIENLQFLLINWMSSMPLSKLTWWYDL